ncbi:MAG: MBL fold metallo-hydrolase [Pseudomonadota bacterium]
MRLIPLGVGDAFSTRSFATAFVVEHGGTRLLVDCPQPIFRMLAEATDRGLGADDIDLIFVTHLHPDHASGLELLGWDQWVRQSRRLTVVAHAEVVRELRTQDWANKLLHLVPVPEASSVQRGPFVFKVRRTRHTVPTAALLLTAEGHSLGYSSDTPFDDELCRWLEGADLVLHEAGEAPVHASLVQLSRLPASTLRKLRLVHLPDRYIEATAPLEQLAVGRWYDI